MDSVIDTSRRIGNSTASWTVEYITNRYSLDNAGILYLPEGQRQWAWRGEIKMQSLVDSILHNYPIPGCILNSELINGQERFAIYDGRHRIETMKKFRENKFKFRGKFFKDLSQMDRVRFLEASIMVTITSNASMYQLADIFTRLNAGVSLKSHDLCWAHRGSRLMKVVNDVVLKNERLHNSFGGGDIMIKRTRLANWTALTLGLSCKNPGMMTKSWIRLAPYIDEDVNVANVQAGIDAIATLFEQVNHLYPIQTKHMGQWSNIGNCLAFFCADLYLTNADTAITKWIEVLRRTRTGSKTDRQGMLNSLKTSGAQNLTTERVSNVLSQVNVYLNGGKPPIVATFVEDMEE